MIILEELLLDAMYTLPSQKRVKEFVITSEMVERSAPSRAKAWPASTAPRRNPRPLSFTGAAEAYRPLTTFCTLHCLARIPALFSAPLSLPHISSVEKSCNPIAHTTVAFFEFSVVAKRNSASASSNIPARRSAFPITGTFCALQQAGAVRRDTPVDTPDHSRGAESSEYVGFLRGHSLGRFAVHFRGCLVILLVIPEVS